MFLLLLSNNSSTNIIYFAELDLGVYIVGSSANGFGTNDSDMDICVVVSHEEVCAIVFVVVVTKRLLTII